MFTGAVFDVLTVATEPENGVFGLVPGTLEFHEMKHKFIS